MEPEQTHQTAEEKILLLRSEIEELEIRRKSLLSFANRVLRNGCLSVLLMGAAAAAVWMVPRPIPLGYLVVILAIGGTGFYFATKITREKKKSNEEVRRETALIYEIQDQIKAKRIQLAELEKHQ
jgi:hypothetical protein